MRPIDNNEVIKIVREEVKDEDNTLPVQFRAGVDYVLKIIDELPTVKAIPVEWIYKWLENIPNNWRGYADDWNYNIESEVKKIVYKNNTVILLPCITDMLDDWMEENK